jgi:hypothetical protein
MRDESFDTQLEALEGRLRSLTPHARIDRDRLIFAAGERAGRRRLRLVNRALAGTSVALAVWAAFASLAQMTEKTAHDPPSNLAAASRPNTRARPSTSNSRTTVDGNPRSLALAEGPTSQRLLQIWARNGQSFELFDDSSPAERSISTTDSDSLPASTSRELLLRYLQSNHDRL